MKEFNIKVKTSEEDVANAIVNDLSRYECNYQIGKDDKMPEYNFNYQSIPYTKLFETRNRTPDQYKKDITYFNYIGNVLTAYGLSSKHKGYKYCVECIRLMNIYGLDSYSMVKDVYPVVSSWYEVSPSSIEHNIRNAINNSWKRCNEENALNKENNCINMFKRKPTNIVFLKHIAKVTNYLIYDA